MTDIDWSKAPEGVTHYMPETESSHAVWVMVSGNTHLAWLASGDSSWEIDRSLEEDREYLIPRPAPQWNGEGLPPVGAVCEHEGTESAREPWIEVEILAHAQVRGFDVAVFQYGDTISYSTARHFRPIKTHAQIAAEEREAAAKAMRAIVTRTHPAECPYLTLYDAGYRLTKGDDQ